METIRIRKRLDSETLHLPELRPMLGREVEIIVQDAVETEPTKDISEKPIWEQFQEVAAKLSDDARQRLPTDGAAQHDHYLYGSPKRKT
jgi:hypothetical protein